MVSMPPPCPASRTISLPARRRSELAPSSSSRRRSTVSENYEAALDILSDLEDQYPDEDWPQIPAMRGDIYYALGRRADAIRQWDIAWRTRHGQRPAFPAHAHRGGDRRADASRSRRAGRASYRATTFGRCWPAARRPVLARKRCSTPNRPAAAALAPRHSRRRHSRPSHRRRARSRRRSRRPRHRRRPARRRSRWRPPPWERSRPRRSTSPRAMRSTPAASASPPAAAHRSRPRLRSAGAHRAAPGLRRISAHADGARHRRPAGSRHPARRRARRRPRRARHRRPAAQQRRQRRRAARRAPADADAAAGPRGRTDRAIRPADGDHPAGADARAGRLRRAARSACMRLGISLPRRRLRPLVRQRVPRRSDRDRRRVGEVERLSPRPAELRSAARPRSRRGSRATACRRSSSPTPRPPP